MKIDWPVLFPCTEQEMRYYDIYKTIDMKEFF